MELDHRALPNAGLWFLGRLQTDADHERVLDGLRQAHGRGDSALDLGGVVQRLASRWFVVRNAQASSRPLLMQPRQAPSPLRGPMTRSEIRRARELRNHARLDDEAE